MPRHRAPHGVVTCQPIALRLLPAELEQVKALAKAEMRPLANMSRLLLLQGLKTNTKATKAATSNIAMP